VWVGLFFGLSGCFALYGDCRRVVYLMGNYG
jgi:hypothetical protein